MWWLIILVVFVLVLVATFFYSWTMARRLDLLHRRVMASRLAIGRGLVKRAAEALQLSETNLLAPETAEQLKNSARRCLEAADDPLTSDKLGLVLPVAVRDIKEDKETQERPRADRYLLESELSKSLRESLQKPQREVIEKDPLGKVLLEDIDATSYRLRVLRTMHNQDVAQIIMLRRKWATRAFHLAGRAAVPEYIDYDDGI